MSQWGFALGERGPQYDEVATETDAATLALWYRKAVETIEVLKAQIEGSRETGTADPDWLGRAGRKIGYLRMLSRWAEFRLIELDLPVPYLPSDPRQEQLRRNDATIRRLQAELRAARAAIDSSVENSSSLEQEGCDGADHH